MTIKNVVEEFTLKLKKKLKFSTKKGAILPWPGGENSTAVKVQIHRLFQQRTKLPDVLQGFVEFVLKRATTTQLKNGISGTPNDSGGNFQQFQTNGFDAVCSQTFRQSEPTEPIEQIVC